MAKLGTNDSKNAGFVSRVELCTRAKPFELIMPLFVDVLNREKMLLPGVDMRLRFYWSSPAFYLMANAADIAELKIERFELLIRKVHLTKKANTDILC